MASQGPNNPGTASGWTSSNNSFASDNSYATTTLLSGSTDTVLFSITNFSFSIPSGATIDGIVAEIERKVNSTSRNPKDSGVLIVKGGSASGTDKASASVWPTSDAYATYGTSSDLWGLSWTDTDINASNFGVRIGCKRDAGAKGTTTYSIDHIRITVYYTAAAGGIFNQSRFVMQAVNRASTY